MKKGLISFLFYFVCFLTSLSSESLKLIWQVDTTKLWEEEWLNEIMQGIDYEVVKDGNYEQCIDRSIIVISAWTDHKQYVDYFTKLHDMGYKFGVILIGDEFYYDTAIYYPQAEFVIRNYWHKVFLNQEKVLTIPLGYKRGFWNGADKQSGDVLTRPYVWCFAGRITPKRALMAEAMKQVPHHYIHEIHGWADPKALSSNDYRDLMLKSIFAPCPRGDWNLDSFRVYEALECGCIPIVEKVPTDYFAHFLGEHPFLAVDSWDQAPAMIADLLTNPQRLEKKRLECVAWWKEYKLKTNKKVVDLVNGAFGDKKEPVL